MGISFYDERENLSPAGSPATINSSNCQWLLDNNHRSVSISFDRGWRATWKHSPAMSTGQHLVQLFPVGQVTGIGTAVGYLGAQVVQALSIPRDHRDAVALTTGSQPLKHRWAQQS